ncbi:MAG TPA: NCS2 family permease [candidate division Zixibacteria bacterium]|nr:NCS2 family permease [candidate division Zixibacteria bacterium]
MTEAIRRYFQFEEHGATFRRELIGGATTFMTMSYIIIVNPKILEVAGIPFGPSMVATILTAFFGTLLMGVYARRPFAIAPYMGENAFIAFTVVQVLGYSWQSALGAIFIGGLLFTLITIFGVRSWLANAIPQYLKIGFAVGIGLFLTFIGLNETGIVGLGVEGAPVHVGDFGTTSILLAIVGFVLIAVMMLRRVKAALLMGILLTTVLAFLFGEIRWPADWVSLPPSLGPIFLKLDIGAALTWGFFSVILTVLVMDFVDTMGTLLGLSLKAGLLDDRGNLPEMEKPMLCDALATVFAALVGTSTAGAFIESATGIQSGARTGLASVFTALLFLLALFLAPFLTVVPPAAYGPALIIVGLLMLSPITKLDFDDLSEAVPAFVVIALMSFTYNLGIGITAGFVTYPVMKVFSGRVREVHPGMWVLAVMSALFFVFYPY